MNSKKWVHSLFFYAVSAAGILAIVIMATASAHATGNTPRCDDGSCNETEQHQGQAQGQAQGQGQGQAQGQHAEGGDATGGAATASGAATAQNEGNTLDAGDSTTSNKSVFFSFNTSLPNAGECFGAVQGGGGDGGGAGFFGIRPLNNDCWYDRIAEAEESVELRARLKCASKMFRNAVAYNYPRKERQTRCITYMVDTYIEQIAFERANLEDALAAQTLLINDHTTKETVRTTDRVTRAVEHCTDCFGERAK